MFTLHNQRVMNNEHTGHWSLSTRLRKTEANKKIV